MSEKIIDEMEFEKQQKQFIKLKAKIKKIDDLFQSELIKLEEMKKNNLSSETVLMQIMTAQAYLKNIQNIIAFYEGEEIPKEQERLSEFIQEAEDEEEDTPSIFDVKAEE